MENKFYVGIVCHKKKISSNILKEKRVLYTSDDNCYVDLEKNKEYTTDTELNEYVDNGSLVPTDISDYNIDYAYLLSKYNSKKLIRRR